ncbi:hypothetical protein BDE36_1593 [Arcticibacter tournemirensis]|uniref:Lipocalin-like domain-containing protein n=1 Tax=Arcticibacter tournemirensis TaxID=699437 RepID=A0A5M9HFW8_9SPHI|nr:hypothetical protein [Arcticibacter tournemirensis]KAA8484421.1 hypothetical protein F1649_06520 [Arcticibacter tournemirensis]TQM49865.1 hypothetical protein BDE36_1593 [Arcticibacter tournemirensis]
MRRKACLLIFFSFLINSCKRDGVFNPEGTYKGRFIYTIAISSSGPTIAPASIRFENETFTSTAGQNRIPAGGSGTFKINGRQIEFADTNAWTADFNWALILSGKYAYKTRADSLFLTRRTNDGNTYEYRLKRIP